MRCADGYREETRSMRRCVYRKQLDLKTLERLRTTLCERPVDRLSPNDQR